jgi:biopolymer transport protein ExbD
MRLGAFGVSAKNVACYCAVIMFLAFSGLAHSADIPPAQPPNVQHDKTPIIVSIDEAGQIYLQDKQVKLNELAPGLRAITDANATSSVYLRGDKDTSYGHVMDVMSAIRSAGFKVALVAKEPKAGIDLAETAKHQLMRCWNAPIGAADAVNFRVELIIDKNPDGTVKATDIVDKSRYASDPPFHALADSAVRAAHNPKCNPLDLPADTYDYWKHIDAIFDPRDML